MEGGGGMAVKEYFNLCTLTQQNPAREVDMAPPHTHTHTHTCMHVPQNKLGGLRVLGR